MKKFGLSIFILTSLISCSVNHATNEVDNSDDEISVMISGDFIEPQSVTFKDVEVTTRMEQISATEEVEVLEINAFSGNETNQYINFKAPSNSTGNNLLFNNYFFYKFDRNNLTATFLNQSVNLNVLTNNETEFTATLSGNVKHFEQTTQELLILKISSGRITIKH